MRQLGISLYPEKSELSRDIEYLKAAQSLGFSRVFISFLQLIFIDKEILLPKYRAIIKEANTLGYDVFVDVAPFVYKILGIEPKNLEYFHEMGIKGLRLDTGFSLAENSELTQNTLGMTIEINMSINDGMLEQLLRYKPNSDQLVGCHNFFPQRFSGLSIDQFIETSKRFRHANLKTAAFITSLEGEIGPWPLQEGLCTLEIHRDIPVDTQVKWLKQSGLIDDIIVGNAYASMQELEMISKAFFSPIIELEIENGNGPMISDVERELLGRNHEYRADCSDYMIRSSNARFLYFKTSIPWNGQRPQTIERGDILILNEGYQQYKAEVQIALKTRPYDERINVIGRLRDDQFILLDQLGPLDHFTFRIND